MSKTQDELTIKESKCSISLQCHKPSQLVAEMILQILYIGVSAKNFTYFWHVISLQTKWEQMRCKWKKKTPKNSKVNKHIESWYWKMSSWRKTSTAIVLTLWRKGECISETHKHTFQYHTPYGHFVG